jgi:DNA repair ATPase RecN
MVIDIDEMKNKLNRLKGQRDLLIEQKKDSESKKALSEETHDLCLKARIITQAVAESTQKQLEYHFSNLVSLALAIFPDPYTFELRFVPKRNKVEAELVFIKDGNETDDILNTGGGGVADIASLALLFSCHRISGAYPILLLDEPAKFVSVDLQNKASEMLKRLSKELGIQIIMNSHLPNIIAAADNIINIEEVKGE